MTGWLKIPVDSYFINESRSLFRKDVWVLLILGLLIFAYVHKCHTEISENSFKYGRSCKDGKTVVLVVKSLWSPLMKLKYINCEEMGIPSMFKYVY